MKTLVKNIAKIKEINRYNSLDKKLEFSFNAL